jgi:large subunit ribosomal protein L2
MKTYRPMTAGLRQRVQVDYSKLNKKTRAGKHLRKRLFSKAGRNNQGRITLRFRGCGHKQLYRAIDFLREKQGVPARVQSLEYDPNRSCFVALLNYADGDKRYIIAPDAVQVGDTLLSGPGAPIRPGNSLPLSKIPVGTVLHAVEMVPGHGAQLARSAGTSLQLMAKDDTYAILRMPSAEIRKVPVQCRATVGVTSNGDHRNRSLGKAGRKRNLGFRPHQRGSAMNACDHPHGGGEGKAPIGHPAPRSPWGWKTLGVKTRNPNKLSNKYIVRSRANKSE